MRLQSDGSLADREDNNPNQVNHGSNQSEKQSKNEEGELRKNSIERPLITYWNFNKDIESLNVLTEAKSREINDKDNEADESSACIGEKQDEQS